MDIKTTYNVKVGTPESLTNFNKLSNKDLPLIQTQKIDTQFNQGKHRVDVHFYSLDGRLLQSKVNSTNYSIQAGSSNVLDEVVDIIVDPTKDVVDAGYENGDINVLYNFVNTLYSNSNTRPIFYVESISPDRREIRALTNDLDKDTIVDFTNQIKTRLEEQPYFEDFRTNFGKNKLPIAVNIETSEYKGDQAIFIRFYDALPTEFTVKSTFLVEELIGNSVLYEVTTKVDAEAVDGTIALRGANFNIELVEENNNPTGYLSYDELFSYPVTNSYYEVYSLFNEKGAQISIDHSDFSEFIQFSSAEERIRNFYYKASLLESYRNQIVARASLTASIEENIRGIVNNFDHYDRYLYFETGSDAWPKNSSTRPYTLFSTGSSQVQSWYTGKINQASLFDAQNQDRLTNTIPSFIREDLNNAPYSLFVDMIGQHFDNLWIYSKAVTSKYDADNRLDFGISKDLVRDAVENFGITLYNNNEALENLFSAFTGESYNSGSEDIRSLIVAVEGSGSLTGSLGNSHLQPMPKSSYQKEVYKRIYHNIPLLLKSKGTERGLRALINSLGVPSDTLSIKMYGGATESGSIFYGSETEFTSSLDKIRISNTDTVTTGSTLSSFTSVVKPGKDYSTDLHTVEVGFSPTDNLNKFIKAHPSMSSFNIDEYIGDPGLAYSSNYATLDELADTVFTSGSSYTNVYNAFDFVRLIKFFDNSLFRVIKDFVPARSNISTGIIVKPHILDRSKVKQPEVKWSNQTSPKFLHTSTDLDYTGSYYSTNFSIDANIETAFITGSTGLDGEYTSSYTETYANPSGGYQILTRNNHDEASYTGEFSGSLVKVSNGNLNEDNPFKYIKNSGFSFKFFPSSSFSSLSSFIQSDFSSTDNVTLWISQSIVSNYTSSTIEALAIPTVSPNAGNIASVLENATEVVFEYVKFITTNEFVTSPRRLSFVNNSGQELQDENIQLLVSENSINSSHEISFTGDTVGGNEPYSASLEIDFANIPNNTQVDIPFNYQVLHTSQGGTDSKLIVQLRDKTTDVAYSGMSFSLDLNNFETGTQLLSFKNETGSPLQNVEFLFRVTVQAVGSPPNNIPEVSITNLQAKYKEDGQGFYSSGIHTRKRLKDAYYYKLTDVITIPTSSAQLGVSSSQQYNVGLLPESNELFRFNDFASTSNSVDSVRNSTTRLTVDERTYTPTQGSYRGLFLPGNYEVISSSIANGVEGLDKRFFAEIQDSNYYSTGWRNGRYDGTETTNIAQGTATVGQEPSLTFSSFNGSLFSTNSTTAEIEAIFSGSDKKEDDVEVYFNTYGLNKKNDLTLTSVASAVSGTPSNPTVSAISVTNFTVNLPNNNLGEARYSGSIGPVGSSNLVRVTYTLLFENLLQSAINSGGSNLTLRLIDGTTVKASKSVDIKNITQGTVQTFETHISPPSTDIVNAALQFYFDGFEGDGSSSPDITLNILDIKRFSDGTLIPSTINSNNIVTSSTYKRTILSKQIPPTPTNSSGYERLISAKVYRFDTGEVYTTNDRGIVTNIE